MDYLRRLARVYRRALLTFVLAALAMQALVPAGLMAVPAEGHGARIVLCPQTHPLARAAAAKATAETAAMAAMHAAMGHGPTDHAAMGHVPASPEDAAQGSAAASGGQSCAFAGAGALAGFLPERGPDLVARAPDGAPAPLTLEPLRIAAPQRLRPPLRAPPALT